ncbi:MAG: hypothetical protein UX49_C0002G0041 [Candidatus Wolfebacteria bacterium GW2011_GWC2_46_275]|uniref:Uncharacterized protein n=1 Tax=Candidatus Wolfebacteria bacterium GW2011_GWA2_47_9b TaxID=1619005 RepID=A0A0G1U7H0_9BACT|nr:MAG: hypothetical protein UX49_C0002G0041 [Candidatus Wolfebacteria bacterium GW2011_GWC2_46_275]KKU54380.1 MAG: hypothetical protein UX76_C0003G0076 [Candidatus Wolfebacteria bacterium GW2011_GWC1_47_103]KKU73602.1 MAG: hypothetical protein UX96_C0003G0040 [Candidatus Wolfebacteria bacterium GW2011_GWB1_47_243]KKU90072.1 MAG: hypothetical protein UY19_C0006G0010 [Candidatus Wolfebacteria bacterium GW2011_GWA2_47_9b]
MANLEQAKPLARGESCASQKSPLTGISNAFLVTTPLSLVSLRHLLVEDQKLSRKFFMFLLLSLYNWTSMMLFLAKHTFCLVSNFMVVHSTFKGNSFYEKSLGITHNSQP